jgi:hypothetical protein
MSDKVLSTKNQLEDFRESLIWKDILAELNRLDERTLLEYGLVGEPHTKDNGQVIVPNTSETLIHLGDIKGRRKAVDYFRQILDILIGEKEENKNDSEYSEPD